MQSRMDQSNWEELIGLSDNPEAFTALIKKNPEFWDPKNSITFPHRLFEEAKEHHNAFRLAISANNPEAVEFLANQNPSFMSTRDRLMTLIRHCIDDNEEDYFAGNIDKRTRIKNINDLHKIFQIVILRTAMSSDKKLHFCPEADLLIHIYAAYGATTVPTVDQAGKMLFDLVSIDTRHNSLAPVFQGVQNPTILANLIFNTVAKKLKIFFSNNFNQCLEALLFRTAIDNYPQAKTFEEAKVLHRQVLKKEYVNGEAEKMSQIILKAMNRDLKMPMLGLLFSPNHHPLCQWLSSTLLDQYENFGGLLNKKLAIRIMRSVENTMLANIHQDVATVESIVKRVTSKAIEGGCISIT